MKSNLTFIYPDRVIEVTNCTLRHYEDALYWWRFSQSIFGKIACLLFGATLQQVNFNNGMDHACIDLKQVIGIKIVEVR